MNFNLIHLFNFFSELTYLLKFAGFDEMNIINSLEQAQSIRIRPRLYIITDSSEQMQNNRAILAPIKAKRNLFWLVGLQCLIQNVKCTIN